VINPFIALQLLAMDLTDRLKRDEKGASAVEYALLVAGIAVVIVAVVGIFKGKLEGLFNSIDVDGVK
jgi:pilus assembly protein Flp/PilA